VREHLLRDLKHVLRAEVEGDVRLGVGAAGDRSLIGRCPRRSLKA
jgi:hypothetical protein